MTKTKIVGTVEWVSENKESNEGMNGEGTGGEGTGGVGTGGVGTGGVGTGGEGASGDELNSNNEYEYASKGIVVLTGEGFYLFPCPHCSSLIQVKLNDLNCRIFRHGTFKKNGKAINPHLKKKKCEELVKRACIYGCARPFEFVGGGKKNPNDTNCIVRECDYI